MCIRDSPHTGQFIINELPTLVLCGTVWVYGGMEGLPLTAIATVIALMLSLLLLYRYLYLRRIRYCIGTEQLVSEYGIIPVSYTHLDVYKRQNLSFPLTLPKGDGEIVGLEERGRARMDGSGSYKGKAAGSNSSAVSYTHLVPPLGLPSYQAIRDEL